MRLTFAAALLCAALAAPALAAEEGGGSPPDARVELLGAPDEIAPRLRPRPAAPVRRGDPITLDASFVKGLDGGVGACAPQGASGGGSRSRLVVVRAARGFAGRRFR